MPSSLFCGSRREFFELHETSICDPLGDEQAAIVIEGRVVGANKFPRREVVTRFGAQRAHLCLVRPAVAEICQRPIVFVDERDARVEIRDHREFALLIEMAGGANRGRQETPVFALERKRLQSPGLLTFGVVFADDQQGFGPAAVDKKPVRMLRVAGRFAGPAKRAHVATVAREVMDIIRPVTIGEVDVAVWRDRDIRRPVLEIAPLVPVRFLDVPEEFASERHLEKAALQIGEIKDFASVLLDQIEAMRAAEELGAPGPDEVSLGIEHHNAIPAGRFQARGVEHVHAAIAIYHDPMGKTPLNVRRKLSPAVVEEIAILSLAHDHRCGVDGQETGSDTGGCERGEKAAARGGHRGTLRAGVCLGQFVDFD